tara:strand:+ start:83 stop:1555 length:1473 start_codon:yes stop_codon:yes gene_type:complete
MEFAYMLDRHDVLVVGTGVAGLSAALAAHQSGASVLVIDRAPQDEYGGNTRYTEAFLRMTDMDSVSDDFEERFLENSGWYPDPVMVSEMASDRENWPSIVSSLPMNDPDVISRFSERAGPTLRWLNQVGIKFETASTPFLTTSTTRLAPIGGGYAIVEALREELIRLEVRIEYETTATGLITKDDGSISGLLCDAKDKGRICLEAKAVLLCCGGFEGSTEMLSRYIGPRASFIRPIARGGFYNKGEGIRMAIDIGASVSGQFGLFHAEPMDPRSGKPEAAIFGYPYGILINKMGNRFVDEARGSVDATYERVTRQIMQQPEGLAYAVFDDKTTDIPRFSTSIRTDQPPLQADSIQSLAGQMNIPSKALEKTISEYNRCCLDGSFEFSKPDGLATQGLTPSKSNWARPIDRQPYRAYPMIAGNVFTFGGLKVDPDARVLNQDGRPIPGLYAAGETMGIYFNDYVGSTSVLRGATFGKLAGEHAAGRRHSNQ